MERSSRNGSVAQPDPVEAFCLERPPYLFRDLLALPGIRVHSRGRAADKPRLSRLVVELRFESGEHHRKATQLSHCLVLSADDLDPKVFLGRTLERLMRMLIELEEASMKKS